MCWLVGHAEPPGLRVDTDGNMVQCCKRCDKTADEINEKA